MHESRDIKKMRSNMVIITDWADNSQNRKIRFEQEFERLSLDNYKMRKMLIKEENE